MAGVTCHGDLTREALVSGPSMWDRRVVPETSAPQRARAAVSPAALSARSSVFESDRYLAAAARAAPVQRIGESDAATIDEFDSLAAALSNRLAGAVGPAALVLYVLENDVALRMVGAAAVPTHLMAEWCRVSLQLNTPAVVAIWQGRPCWLPDLEKSRRRYVMFGDPKVVWPSRAWLPVRDGNRIIGVAGVLCAAPQSFDPRVRRLVTRRVAEVAPAFLRYVRAHCRPDDWVTDTQAILNILPGSVCVLLPVRDAAGRLLDFELAAASPGAVDAAGRRGRELIGARVLDRYPALSGTEVFEALEQVLQNGWAREIGPFPYADPHAGVPEPTMYTVQIRRIGEKLLVTWERAEESHQYATRLALTERLGNLGWGEWDLTTDTINWSDQLMAIFGRDPVQGPVRLEDLPDIVVADDLAALEEALVGVLERREPMDITVRLRVLGGIRHVRAVLEGEYDGYGRPLRLYGIVRDVTADETARRAQQRLADIERELAERQRLLRAEHRMVSTLQQIILPLPSRPIERPGLRVAVRYQPAEEIARVGGDWYDVVALPCGRTLLAVGDVAGHGITAAATMARLRHALTARAVTTTDPAQLLGYLNRIVCDDPAEPTATVVVARYDPQTGVLAWAQAGHPPPILVSDGVATALRRPGGVLVGARREAVYGSAEVTLPPGSRLLLYTDGLIERRSRSAPDWLRPILATLSSAEGYPVDALLERLRPANPDDDMCVLGLHLLPSA
jgi:PAS domain-containing protein